MSSLNERTVLKADLHGTFMVFGLGNIGPTLSKDTKGKLDMSLTDGGIYVTADGQGDQAGRKVEFVVPLAMCKVIQLAPTNKSGAV